MKRTNLDWLTARLAFVNALTAGDAGGGEGEGGEGSGNSGGNAGTDNANGGGKDPVTFTPEQQAAVDKIVADRLKREKANAKADADKEAERAKLAAEDRLKAEKADEVKKREEAEKRAQEAEWRADLAEHVVDAKKAIKLIDPEKHLNEDGSVNVEAFLKDNPFMKKGGGAEKKDKTGPGTGGTQGKDKPAEDSWAAAEAADRARR